MTLTMSKHQPLSNEQMMNEIEHLIDTNPNSIYPTQARWLVWRIKELEEAIEKHREVIIQLCAKDLPLPSVHQQLYAVLGEGKYGGFGNDNNQG